MADTSGQAEIRGMDVDKLAKGFADEMLVLRKFVTNATTKNRELRWYQKTSGFLDSVDTTGITASQIANTTRFARPVSVEQSWTRMTSYIRNYFLESPMFSEPDLKDNDIDLLATNIRDLVRAVEKQVDVRIYTVLTTGTGRLTGAATAAWETTATCTPILDLLTAEQAIRAYGYEPSRFICYMNSLEYKDLINYLITVKGSSIPDFASSLIRSGVLMSLLNFDIVVSENATAGQIAIFVPLVAATWKSFTPITSTTVKDPGIGTKIRVWEDGECLLTDPKASYLLTGA
jgi:hypothetical protein